MVNAFRAIQAGRWVLIAAMAVAYGSVGLGCGHEHHDDGYYNQAGYRDNGYYRDYSQNYGRHYDRGDYDHDRY